MVMYVWDHKQYHKTFFPDQDFEVKKAPIPESETESTTTTGGGEE